MSSMRHQSYRLGRLPLVLFRKAVIRRFERAVRNCRANIEVGGILLGSYRGPHIEIIGVTEPGSGDISSAFSFNRRDKCHQAAAMRAWTESYGTVTYLGEWHTHPAGGPHPSTVDLENWHAVANQVQNAMLFVIASPKGWQPYVCHPASSLAVGLSNIQIGMTGDVYANER